MVCQICWGWQALRHGNVSMMLRSRNLEAHPMHLLFICTHNRCRSILSEAITNHLGYKTN